MSVLPGSRAAELRLHAGRVCTLQASKTMDRGIICQYHYTIREGMMPTAIRTGAKNNRDLQAGNSSRDHLNNRLFFRLFQAANVYETQAVRELNFSAVTGATLGALSRDPNGMLFSEL